MAYTRKKYKNGRPRRVGDSNGQATDSGNSKPKRYPPRTGTTLLPFDNYLRKTKVRVGGGVEE